MNIVLAGETGIESLYHYQPFDKQRTRPILLKSCLYMSVPKHFNDPWDCRPCFDLSRLTDPAIREEHIQFLIGADRRILPKPEMHHLLNEELLRNRPGHLESVIELMGGEGIGREIDKRYRVYCLTPRPDSALMWSHYAKNHSGICLEFSVDNPVISGAHQVQYCRSYPLMPLATAGDQTLMPLITKSDDWKSEQEYRVIAQEKGAAIGLTLTTENNLLRFPPEILTAVVLGCRTKQADRDVIKGWAQSAGGRFKLKEAVQVPNRYEVRIQPMT